MTSRWTPGLRRNHRGEPVTEDLPPERPSVAVPELDAVLVIDALGKKCPIPIIWVAQRLHEIPIGAKVAVLADDPAAHNDIPAWCGMKSHGFVEEVPLPDGGGAFLIRRCY